MKITKEEAKKLLETAEAILKEYETYTDPETGVTTDDEGNVVSHGWRGGRHSTNGYNRRYYNAPTPRPTPAPTTGTPEDTKWMKYLPSFRNKEWNRGKTDDQLKPAILAWLAKQPKVATPPAAPPVAESMLENEVKAELLETASNLLVQFKEAWKKKEKGWGTSKTEKENDIKKDKGIPTAVSFMPKKEKNKVKGK